MGADLLPNTPQSSRAGHAMIGAAPGKGTHIQVGLPLS
jgi:hypothetical protein